MQNGYVESFNGRTRDELPNKTLFLSLEHVRVVISAWVGDYNQERPHSFLGYETHAALAGELHEQWPAQRSCAGHCSTRAQAQQSCPALARAFGIPEVTLEATCLLVRELSRIYHGSYHAAMICVFKV
jgi:hypothetical protein